MRVPGIFMLRYCECGAEYYLTLSAAAVDDGKCPACTKDIWALDQLFKLEDSREDHRA